MNILKVAGTAGGTVTLSNANTFTGATTVNGGTLDLKNALALQNSTLTLATTGASLVFDQSAGTAFQVGGLNGSGNIALTNSGAANVTLTVSGNTSSYSGTLSGGGSLIKAGSGTLTLNVKPTYTGTTSVTGGTLTLNQTGVTGTTPISISSGAFVRSTEQTRIFTRAVHSLMRHRS